MATKPKRNPTPPKEKPKKKKPPKGGILEAFNNRGKKSGYQALKDAGFIADINELINPTKKCSKSQNS